jgi:hypothetical protein
MSILDWKSGRASKLSLKSNSNTHVCSLYICMKHWNIITYTTLPTCSREKFSEMHARLWWEENRARIHEQYLWEEMRPSLSEQHRKIDSSVERTIHACTSGTNTSPLWATFDTFTNLGLCFLVILMFVQSFFAVLSLVWTESLCKELI